MFMSLRLRNFALLVVFVVLAVLTSTIMWDLFNWRMLPHILLVISVAVIGENLVSSQGYYHYTRQETNGPFVRSVPLWIMFLWVFCVQTGFLVSLNLGLGGISACLMSGILISIADLLLIEPFMSRTMELWRWTPVVNGYFRIVPSKVHRFTAPPGNYVTWFVFPILANCFLVSLMIFF